MIYSNDRLRPRQRGDGRPGDHGELRSVNARYFEYTSRIPRSCAFLDSKLKALLGSRIARGKVEVSLTLQNLEASETAVACGHGPGPGLPAGAAGICPRPLGSKTT